MRRGLRCFPQGKGEYVPTLPIETGGLGTGPGETERRVWKLGVGLRWLPDCAGRVRVNLHLLRSGFHGWLIYDEILCSTAFGTKRE